MKMKKVDLFITVLLIVICLGYAYSQEILDPQLTARNQVKQLIDARYGEGYDFEYTMIDAQIYYSKDDKIQDPYGTLTGCVLFSAYRYNADVLPDTFTVGMVKNGQIIWDNYPGTEKNLSDIGFSGEFYYSQDINNDGEVDLIYLQHVRLSKSDREPYVTYINILSWNGTSGRFINNVMVGSEDCELIDADGDGIMEIRTSILGLEGFDEFKTVTYPFVTYGWNGVKYGLWPSVRQVPQSEFLPANILQASVNCNVIKTNNNYEYSYSVTNHQESRQRINYIFIEGIEDPSDYYAPPSWVSGTSIIGGRSFSMGFEKARSMIKPGQTVSNFKTKNVAVANIVKYHIQGYVEGTTCCPSDEEERQNILNNSLIGFTIGPANLPTPFIPLNFLDTLSNYTTQSRSLGWIKDQPTADKYIGYFTSAKTSVINRDTATARITLQHVLQDVDVDSTSNITCEAYALL